MWVILLIGVFSAATAIERFLFLISRSRSRSRSFMKGIIDRLEKGDVEGARGICSHAGKMAAALVVRDILSAAAEGEGRIRASADESILRVVPELEKRTGYLATIGNVATLMGLMGTIYGLILSFASVGKPGIDAVEKSTLLASGIAAAMNTTFMGLMVAIPSIILYSLFRAKTHQLIDEIDEYSLRVVNALSERSCKTAKYSINASQFKDSVSLHVTGNKVKVYADDKLLKEIIT